VAIDLEKNISEKLQSKLVNKNYQHQAVYFSK